MPLPSDYVSLAGVVTRAGRRVRMARLAHQTIINAIAADGDGFKVSVAGPNATTVTYAAADATADGALVSGGRCLLDVPRNVVIVVTHASAVVALSGTITGLDLDGRTITEAWSVTAGGTSKTFTGKKAFRTIVSVTVVAATDASANSVIIGTGSVLGLEVKCAIAKAVLEVSGGSVVTTGTVVATSAAAADDARGTYLPSTIPDGVVDYEIVFVSDDPEAS